MAQRNIEIKARVMDPGQLRAAVEPIATEYVGVLHQVDTYFPCKSGRLKLREIDGEIAQLIWYQRTDQAEPKPSDYVIVEVNDGSALRRALQAALGIVAVVDKRREVFLFENVRIHLDDVSGHGSFLELEAVLGDAPSEETDRKKIDFLLEQFQISSDDLLANSYADMN